jgi:hypothetical protein
MTKTIGKKEILKHLASLEREIIMLKRNILYVSEKRKRGKKVKTSLFGSVKSGDITEKMIEESRHNLFHGFCVKEKS